MGADIHADMLCSKSLDRKTFNNDIHLVQFSQRTAVSFTAEPGATVIDRVDRVSPCYVS
jgi:hypothetical protein